LKNFRIKQHSKREVHTSQFLLECIRETMAYQTFIGIKNSKIASIARVWLWNIIEKRVYGNALYKRYRKHANQ